MGRQPHLVRHDEIIRQNHLKWQSRKCIYKPFNKQGNIQDWNVLRFWDMTAVEFSWWSYLLAAPGFLRWRSCKKIKKREEKSSLFLLAWSLPNENVSETHTQNTSQLFRTRFLKITLFSNFSSRLNLIEYGAKRNQNRGPSVQTQTNPFHLTQTSSMD